MKISYKKRITEYCKFIIINPTKFFNTFLIFQKQKDLLIEQALFLFEFKIPTLQILFRTPVSFQEVR